MHLRRAVYDDYATEIRFSDITNYSIATAYGAKSSISKLDTFPLEIT